MITQTTNTLLGIATGQHGVLGLMALALVVVAGVVVYCFKLFIASNDKTLKFLEEATEKHEVMIKEVREDCAKQILNFVDQLNKCEERCKQNSDNFMLTLNRLINKIEP